MDNKTLSFGKNGEDPVIAFHNIEATELFPCVLFYSTNPGEKVTIYLFTIVEHEISST